MRGIDGHRLDRRVTERTRVEVPARVRFDDQEGPALVSDVSRWGALALCDHFHRPGSDASLRLMVSGDPATSLFVSGEVVRAQALDGCAWAHAIAIEFDDSLSEPVLRLLLAWAPAVAGRGCRQ
jgi:hypothetical protein